MKIQLALLISGIVSCVVAAPHYIQMDSETQSRKEIGKTSLDEIAKQSRADFSEERVFKRAESTPAEEIRLLHKALRKGVKTTKYDSEAAQTFLREFPLKIAEAEQMVKSRSPEGAFVGELKHFRNLFSAFKEAAEASNRFEGCGYAGADLVQKAMDLRVKTLELEELQGGFDEQTPDFISTMAGIESSLVSLENDAKTTPMEPGLKKMFAAQSENVKNAIQYIRRYDAFRRSLESNTKPESIPKAGNENGVKETKKDCFVIEWV
ncbi:hypothetical protein OXX80_000214 [Metschnikowia pulcherrima]